MDTGIVNIRGKSYKTVALRVSEFREQCPAKDGWALLTRVLANNDDYVIMQADICHPDFGVMAQGTAEERRGSSQINKTSALENCECVPLRTRMLTRRGLKHYHQLNVEEDVAAFNGSHIVWVPLKGVHTFEKSSLVRMGNTRFSADCTPNHKWWIDHDLIPLDDVAVNGTTQIRLAAPVSLTGGDIEAAAKLGWIFGDASLQYTNGLPTRCLITQSKHIDRMQELFGRMRVKSPAFVREWPNGTTSECKEHYECCISGNDLRCVLGKFDVSTSADVPEAVLRMTYDELLAFTDSMMLCDGSNNTYAKTDLHLAESMRLAFFLLGHATSKITARSDNAMTTKSCWTVNRHKHGYKYMSEFKVDNIPPQEVWCPTTQFGTWVGDFDGRLAITGNTSAIGRALAAFGLGGSEYASANEVENAVHQQQAPKTKEPKLTAEQKGHVANGKKAIAEATSTEELKDVGTGIKDYSPAVRNVLRPVWDARNTELKKKEKVSEHS